ncbi:MAG: hypothetical protein JWQ35_385 [Bacteriovoracaceae bacterium]|nr:hypothetical protein [Bacteriovoracaceae bacterium]
MRLETRQTINSTVQTINGAAGLPAANAAPLSSPSAAPQQPILTASQEDRTKLLKEIATITLEATNGIKKINDQQVSQILGGLVRTKLLSADDSYLLRDRILDTAYLDNALDQRIEAALRRKGIVSEENNRRTKTATA